MEKKRKPHKDSPEPKPQFFKIELLMKTGCEERIDKEFVENWALDQFHGADVGEIVSAKATELGTDSWPSLNCEHNIL